MSSQDPMREHLKELASTEHQSLDELARARVRQAVLRAQGRRRPHAVQLGAWTLAVAAALCIAWFSRAYFQAAPEPRSVIVVSDQAKRSMPPPASEPACGQVVNGIWNRVGKEQHLDLLARAMLVADGRASVHTVRLESCDTRIRLESGNLWVHARDLKGGALSVETPLGLVEVKGTVFSVRADRTELHVRVDEGKVWVTPRDGQALVLAAGDQLTLRKRRPAKSKASDAAVELPMEILREKVWHGGSVSPSAEPFDPGSSVTEEGRPMQKPHVVKGDAP